MISPTHELLENAMVATLIIGNPPTWNAEVLKANFIPYDIEGILKIPLSDWCHPDRLIWHETNNGKYTIRSAYCVLLKEKWLSNPGSSRKWEPGPIWKKIWSLRVPVKVKIFVWRACHDSLPKKMGLFQRKVLPNPRCDNSDLAAEDSLYAFWTCPALCQT
jgi:hypothetical protein